MPQCLVVLLYLIEIPHQTTTCLTRMLLRMKLYLIEIPHQTTTYHEAETALEGCILSKFHIKPQHLDIARGVVYSCILSKFHIKPQHADTLLAYWDVVSYRNSTSNHNNVLDIESVTPVVSYRNSTSNHNGYPVASVATLLYLIEIPHQTTTFCKPDKAKISCILSKFHIKPQLEPCLKSRHYRCILSKFHIKPQLCCMPHNWGSCCILSKFHIKPQLNLCLPVKTEVVSYRNSTSNHNYPDYLHYTGSLYLIEIPHQTTTAPPS